VFWFLIVLLIVAASRRPREPTRRIRSASEDPPRIRTASRPPGPDLTELIDAYCAEAAELIRAASKEPNRVKAAAMRRRAAEIYFRCEKLDEKKGG